MQLYTAVSSRPRVVKCRCETSRPIASFVKRVFDKRSKSVKDNLSKLSMIGAADYKELVEVVNELDQIHRKAFEGLTGKCQTSAPKTDETVSDEKKVSIFDE